MTRKKIPADIKQLVLHEAGYRCANPNCKTIITLDIHHLIEVSEGGKNDAHNLLPLCPNCHALYHREDIPRTSIRAWKMLLLSLNEAFNRQSIDILFAVEILSKDKHPFVISGDSLASCASLIATDLIQIELSRDSTGMPFYEATLTTKGTLFLEAWRKGDQAAAVGSNIDQ